MENLKTIEITLPTEVVERHEQLANLSHGDVKKYMECVLNNHVSPTEFELNEATKKEIPAKTLQEELLEKCRKEQEETLRVQKNNYRTPGV